VLSKVESFDATDALKVPGVIEVIEMPALTENPVVFKPLGGVAVLATNTWAAQQARNKLKIKWSASPNDGYNSAAFRKTMETANLEPGDVHRSSGDIDAALASAAQRHTAEYYVPHQSQAPMEPPRRDRAFRRWRDGSLVLHTEPADRPVAHCGHAGAGREQR
jgi:isoquinoline 1-oxidoreductase beta subunit